MLADGPGAVHITLVCTVRTLVDGNRSDDYFTALRPDSIGEPSGYVRCAKLTLYAPGYDWVFIPKVGEFPGFRQRLTPPAFRGGALEESGGFVIDVPRCIGRIGGLSDHQEDSHPRPEQLGLSRRR